jgi:hypothetical protein
MVCQAQLILLLFYYRLHVSTYIQVIFRPFDRRVCKCYACWDPIAFTDSPVKSPEDDLYVDRSKHVDCNKTTIQSVVWGNLREEDHWGDPDVDVRIILRWIFRKWEGVGGTGWSWFRIGTGGGHL